MFSPPLERVLNLQPREHWKGDVLLHQAVPIAWKKATPFTTGLNWLVVSTHLKNMLVKLDHETPRIGVKIPKIFELPPPSWILKQKKYPYAPWDWNIYLYIYQSKLNVGKYSNPMEHLGYVSFLKKIPTRWFKPWPFDSLVGGHQITVKGSRFHHPKPKKLCFEGLLKLELRGYSSIGHRW